MLLVLFRVKCLWRTRQLQSEKLGKALISSWQHQEILLNGANCTPSAHKVLITCDTLLKHPFKGRLHGFQRALDALTEISSGEVGLGITFW